MWDGLNIVSIVNIVNIVGWLDALLTHGDGSGSGPLVFLMWPGIAIESIAKNVIDEKCNFFLVRIRLHKVTNNRALKKVEKVPLTKNQWIELSCRILTEKKA